ncbi:flagellar basal-body MS-ring/collar protein FliF [Solidesulfovibrio sp.]|uniref:flagellar basal-body MS-ring/collar protein FliF n=1 Tax=Solidesulfovibrio sp. TaxID=2910990 RepID=UPI000EED9A2C|nr:flagellar basal-body MS-ring/collar protein FliF [Solidesulfovibrio sp.]MEA5090283.1 flagellar basal-body MS-ring/collar protein FliF [Solidesulfovibrio sp.]HCR11827.1 flagellar M-ring protein FliF [Desulfovibrio sp.]HML60547.1 flagellar basal-body MS-ring/collar protein FliF [Solidesulfovibrio sp.]
MPPFLKQNFEKLIQYWSNRSNAQRVMLAGLALSTAAAFLVMIYFLNQPEMRVLYTNLAPEDAARVVELLKASKTPYELRDGGKTVLVPAEAVYEQRLKVAGEGVMHGQGVGFELFDQLKVGQTDFVQRINYTRALQGELSRTISEFPQVDKARVHLVLPQKSLFIEEQKQASASVVLTLKRGQKLDAKQLQGIVNLVSMSVEGLTPEHITVTDTTGQALYQPRSDGGLGGMSTTQFEFKNTYESNLENRIEQLLTPIVGPGRAIVKANVDLDFSQRTIRKELYDPNATVVRSEQKSEESTSGTAAVDPSGVTTTPRGGGAAVPNTNFNAAGYSGTESTQKSNRTASTTNFEINKEEQNVVTPVGDLKRQSLAVIVDGTYEKVEGKNTYTFVPRKAEELERIKAVVARAAGLDSSRGDEVQVSSFEFGAPDGSGEPSLVQTMLEYAQRLGKPFLNGLLLFLFLILVVRPVVLALIRPRVTEEEIETLERLPEGEARLALAEPGEEGEETPMLESAKQFELAKNLALQLFEENMEQSMTLLKTWLKQEA